MSRERAELSKKNPYHIPRCSLSRSGSAVFYLLYSSGFSGKAQYPVRMEDSAFDWSSCMDTDAAYR